jgi:transposase
MERYLGIDVHRDSSTICVLSATGKRVRQEVVETNGQVLVRYLKQLPGTLHLCIEESTWSEWLHEILSPHVAELVVYQSEWSPGAKSDAIDAQGLAEKLRIGQAGPGIFKAAKRYQKLREWARAYQAITLDTARAKNRLKSLFQRRGIRCLGTGVYDPQEREDWFRQLPPAMRPTAELLGIELDCLVELKAEAERALLQESRRHRISKILETAPGLGPIRTALVVATVVTPHRFRSKRQFWSYCGFGVVTRSSADWVQTQGGWIKARSTQTRGLNRNHHPTLKGIFKSAAMTAICQTKADHPLRADYARLCDAGTRPHLARITIARKIAATVLAMWKREEVYNPVR